jgi:hypothetical protein
VAHGVIFFVTSVLASNPSKSDRHAVHNCVRAANFKSLYENIILDVAVSTINIVRNKSVILY